MVDQVAEGDGRGRGAVELESCLGEQLVEVGLSQVGGAPGEQDGGVQPAHIQWQGTASGLWVDRWPGGLAWPRGSLLRMPSTRRQPDRNDGGFS